MHLALLSLAAAPPDPVASTSEPFSIGMLLLLVVLFFGTLGISALCSLMEATLLSLNPLWLKSRDTDAMPTARAWLELKQRIERPISAILVVNTLANTGLPTVAGAIFLRLFGANWLWAFTLSLTVSVVIFGELVPKILGVNRASELAPRLLRPLHIVMKIFGPLAGLAQKVSDRFSRDRGDTPAESPIMDIITLTQAAKAENAIHGQEEIIIIHAATLSARRVSASMTPADSVRVFDARLSLRENLAAMGDFVPAACPVSEDGSLEKASGCVRMREILVAECLGGPEAGWRDKVRPVPVVGARDSLTHLLAEFLEGDTVAALVRDGRGANVGWITMDDVSQILMGKG